MELGHRIGRELNKLPQEIKPKCPVCASSLVFDDRRWKCGSCRYSEGR